MTIITAPTNELRTVDRRGTSFLLRRNSTKHLRANTIADSDLKQYNTTNGGQCQCLSGTPVFSQTPPLYQMVGEQPTVFQTPPLNQMVREQTMAFRTPPFVENMPFNTAIPHHHPFMSNITREKPTSFVHPNANLPVSTTNLLRTKPRPPPSIQQYANATLPHQPTVEPTG